MNARDKKFSYIGVFDIFPFKIHYNEDSLAMILSMKDMVNIPGVRVHMDMKNEWAIYNDLENGDSFKFVQCESGLYYYDLDNYNKSHVIGYSALETVKTNKNKYKKSNLDKAKNEEISIITWLAYRTSIHGLYKKAY